MTAILAASCFKQFTSVEQIVDDMKKDWFHEPADRATLLKVCPNFLEAEMKFGEIRVPDANIDHRRVPNLDTFFKRQQASLPVTNAVEDYQPGDVIYWKIGNLDHVGILIDEKGPSGCWKAMHNMGWGQHAEDVLFAWEIKGHYRYLNTATE